MFIAIIGTILSGKSTIETYLTEKGFVPVKVISRAVNYEVRAEARNTVSSLHALFHLHAPDLLDFF
jgi:dephospho-CoA kinase